MSIHKDNATGKWRVVYRYIDWTGKTKQTSKRGFPTKREAQMWEREQMLKHDAKLDMTFASFYEIYVEDKKERIRDNTWGTKNNIVRTKILPYFGERKIGEIEPRDVIAWQNHLLAFKRELVEVLQVEMQPNALSRKLNVSLERLILEYGIQYKAERGHDGRKIRLAFVGKQA